MTEFTDDLDYLHALADEILNANPHIDLVTAWLDRDA